MKARWAEVIIVICAFLQCVKAIFDIIKVQELLYIAELAITLTALIVIFVCFILRTKKLKSRN